MTVSFTPTETVVLKLTARGMSNVEISEALTLSTSTVKTHLVNVFVKIGARNRTQAALYALRTGLVTLEPVEPVEP